jgi:hypothetical protein
MVTLSGCPDSSYPLVDLALALLFPHPPFHPSNCCKGLDLLKMARLKQMELSAPLDLSHHFSSTTVRRESSNLKRLYKYYVIPGMGNLSGGMQGELFLIVSLNQCF